MNPLDAIREKLGHFDLEWSPSTWLNTGIPDLNTVIGHCELGIPYGRITEISGWESHGKTAIAIAISALAQNDGAAVVWGDLENSLAHDWAIKRGLAPCPKCGGKGRIPTPKGKDAAAVIINKSCRECGKGSKCRVCAGKGCNQCADSGEIAGCGLDTSRLVIIHPYVGQFPVDSAKPEGKSITRMSTAQELCEEIEACVAANYKNFARQIVVIDSLVSLLTENEAADGITGFNARTNVDQAMFVGRLLRRWVGTMQSYNAHLILINQLRENPMQRFGSPLYTPCGNAPLFYSHVRVRVTRVKGGRIVQSGTGRIIGIRGVMKAIKNKTGGIEGAEVGYRLLYNGPIEFISAKEVRAEASGNDGDA